MRFGSSFSLTSANMLQARQDGIWHLWSQTPELVSPSSAAALGSSVTGWHEAKDSCALGGSACSSDPSGAGESFWPQRTLPASPRVLLAKAPVPLGSSSLMLCLLHQRKWLRLSDGSFRLSAQALVPRMSSRFHICRTNLDFFFMLCYGDCHIAEQLKMNHQRHSRDESTGSVLGTASISPPVQNAL